MTKKTSLTVYLRRYNEGFIVHKAIKNGNTVQFLYLADNLVPKMLENHEKLPLYASVSLLFAAFVKIVARKTKLLDFILVYDEENLAKL